MGLDIHGKKSDKNYHAAYSGLHLIRYMALVDCGYPTSVGDEPSSSLFPTCYILPKNMTAKDLNDIVLGVQLAAHTYPNLMLHSDCDGTYTLKGSVNVFDGDDAWMTGNSKGLLKELTRLKEQMEDRFRHTHNWALFIMLYELVKDEVEKGEGEITFS